MLAPALLPIALLGTLVLILLLLAMSRGTSPHRSPESLANGQYKRREEKFS
jgi:hypothetical protein